MGGLDETDNIEYLTTSDHANAHKILWEKYNQEEDYIAWKSLSGQMTHREATRNSIINSNKTRIVTDATKIKIGKTSKGRRSKLYYVTSENTKKTIRNSVLDTLSKTDYVKCNRKMYNIIFPSGIVITSNNIKKSCMDFPEMPSPSCIRTQHSRNKISWNRGKYKGFTIQISDNTRQHQECSLEDCSALEKVLPTSMEWNKTLVSYEKEDSTTGTQQYACSGDKCEIVDIVN